MPAVETFDTEMIKRFLERYGLDYETPKHGHFLVWFPEESGVVWGTTLAVAGEQNNIYMMQSASNLSIPGERWGKALMFCNDWNREMRWPKAYLDVQDWDTDTATDLLIEYQNDYKAGIHRELFEDITLVILGASGVFWEKAHRELGHG